MSFGPTFNRYLARHNVSVFDKVPADMIHLVDPHWNQFPPLATFWNYMLGLVMIVLGIISWCGNGVVVYIFSTTKALRTPSNLLVLNLAFSDFMMMVIMSPPMVINCFYESWVLGPMMCDIYAMCGSLFGCTSIWTMTMIAFDRYNVIVKGIAQKPMTIKGAILKIFLIYSFALIWTIAPVLGWNRYVPEGNLSSCGTDFLSKSWLSKSYILVYSIFVYYSPLFLIIYSYYFIITTVAAHEKAMREQAKKMNVASLRSSEDTNKSAEAKLAKVALITISLWFMAWTPYLVINYIGIFEGPKLTPMATIWGSLFAKANAVYNPIVYGISHPKYRVALKQKLPCLVCGETEPAKPQGESTDTVSQASNATSDGKA